MLMPLNVKAFSVSLDGYGAGPAQDRDNPLGRGGQQLHEWMWATRAARQMIGEDGGESGVDDDFMAASLANVGAWIMGRNMFGPVRGPWPDDSWRGWWGENPPFHVPVFVLTHFPRRSLTLAGGTTFHFVTDGIHSALQQARAAAGGRNVRLGGGVNTLQQYLQARLVDQLHLAIAPILLGAGAALYQGLDLPQLGYRCVTVTPGIHATHVLLAN
jgi:dihydrofolate reductase